MNFQNLPLKLLSPYPGGEPNLPYLKERYEENADLVYHYCKFCDPTIFDKEKYRIQKLWCEDPRNELFHRISKVIWLIKEWQQNGKWLNPLVVTPKQNLYIVHPGQDRYLVMNYLKVTHYKCLIMEADELLETNSENIEKMFIPGTRFKYNKTNFSAFINIDKQMFYDWIEDKFRIDQIKRVDSEPSTL